MRQEEFLNSLQEALAGRVSDRTIQENVNYYRCYINEEIRKGTSEEAVLQGLGEPRLLAKTIEESNKYANGDESYASEYDGWSFQGNKSAQEQDSLILKKKFQFNGVLGIVIAILVLIVVIKLVFSVVAFLAPIILVGAAGLLIYRMLTGSGE